MPPDVSSVNVRIGWRLLVRRTSPGLGTRCRLCARVCSFDMNSPRSARFNAQGSTTCSPWVLMTVTICPAETKAPLPRLAGISIGESVMPAISRADSDHIDLDNSAAGEACHPHRGSGRALVGSEIGRVDLVHPSVVAVEVGQENAHANHVGERQAAALENAAQIVHHLVRLRLDAGWNGEKIVVRIGRKLSGDEDERAGLDGMTVGSDRLRRIG